MKEEKTFAEMVAKGQEIYGKVVEIMSHETAGTALVALRLIVGGVLRSMREVLTEENFCKAQAKLIQDIMEAGEEEAEEGESHGN